jgi:hypothetical protein
MKWGIGKVRAVGDQSARIPEAITSELGRINEMGGGCSMRAVKDSLATPLKRGRENLKAFSLSPFK